MSFTIYKRENHTLEGRNISVSVSGRFHKWNKYVYDGRAHDVATGIRVESRHWKSENGARKHAMAELRQKLQPVFDAEDKRKADILRQQEIQRQRELDNIRRQEQEIARQKIAAEKRRHDQQMAQQMLVHKQQQRDQLNATKRSLELRLQDINANYRNVNGDLTRTIEQIETEEKEIAEFDIERNDESNKVAIVLGHTGDGKSTFCNRMTGDTSKYGKSGVFQTSGGSQSCTQVNSKAVANIDSIRITIVDTPGFGDTNGSDRDRQHSNRLCKYLKGCGGLNAFILIRNATNARFNASYQCMLEKYATMFGDIFFDRLIIVASRVDYDCEQFEMDGGHHALSSDIVDRFDLRRDIPVFPIGVKNYKESLSLLAKAIPNNKFICSEISSPIDSLKATKVELQTQNDSLAQQVESIRNEIALVTGCLNSL